MEKKVDKSRTNLEKKVAKGRTKLEKKIKIKRKKTPVFSFSDKYILHINVGSVN